jgi:hypothetical protein
MDSPIGNSLRKKKMQSQHKRDSESKRPETASGQRNKPVEKKEELYTASFLRRAAGGAGGMDD